MKILLIIPFLASCVSYKYEHIDKDYSCKVSITSYSREMDTGKVRVGKGCTVSGAGEGMKYNKETARMMLQLLSTVK